MFYRAQRNITIYGNATDWNGHGFDKVFPQPSKFRVMCLTDRALYHQDNDRINNIYINARFLRINKHLKISLDRENDYE